MFLPIEVYHSGGSEAQFAPLAQNIEAYEWGLAQYLGAGIGACYRGLTIYDTKHTMAVVKKWVNFYKVRIQSILSCFILNKSCFRPIGPY